VARIGPGSDLLCPRGHRYLVGALPLFSLQLSPLPSSRHPPPAAPAAEPSRHDYTNPSDNPIVCVLAPNPSNFLLTIGLGSWSLPDVPLRFVPGVRDGSALPRPSVGQQ
jgi:hypothetical protein